MEMPDIKALKKLADACRKAGIVSFKCPNFEFTLTDNYPQPKSRKSKAEKPEQSAYDAQAALFESDSPETNELLFWSVNNPAETDSKEPA